MNLWDEVKAIDFENDPMAMLIEAVGLSTAKKLVEAFGGETFYFPKVESVVRLARNRRVYKEFTGFNQRLLADKYNLTSRYVRDIIREQERMKPGNKARQERQMELF